VPVRRREVELSVERPVGATGRPGPIARLTVRFDPVADGTGPTPAELKEALAHLVEDLDAAAGGPLSAWSTGRVDRETIELVETYRPRRRELIDALLADGEITPMEHERLHDHLVAARPSSTPSGPSPPAADPPIAAAPALSDTSLPPARPVAELLRTYQIESLKQAGAVRARRQISFAEYMALKRHFETLERDGADPGGPR
jgi:hypothetical protein